MGCYARAVLCWHEGCRNVPRVCGTELAYASACAVLSSRMRAYPGNLLQDPQETPLFCHPPRSAPSPSPSLSICFALAPSLYLFRPLSLSLGDVRYWRSDGA
eukprot:1694212-Rhodomonas_salina.4